MRIEGKPQELTEFIKKAASEQTETTDIKDVANQLSWLSSRKSDTTLNNE